MTSVNHCSFTSLGWFTVSCCKQAQKIRLELLISRKIKISERDKHEMERRAKEK